MKKILIIIAHPKSDSFNHAIASKVIAGLNKKGLTYDFIDLYKEKYNPILNQDEILRKFSFEEQTQNFCNSIKDYSGIIFIHPNWWGGPPAILKGWLDRIFRSGVAYEYVRDEKGQAQLVQLLKDKKSLVFVSSDKPQDQLEAYMLMWQNSIFGFTGLDGKVETFFELYKSTYAQRKEWLEQIELMVQENFN